MKYTYNYIIERRADTGVVMLAATDNVDGSQIRSRVTDQPTAAQTERHQRRV